MPRRTPQTIVFLHNCPNCDAEYKIIKKCKCGAYICSSCNYENLCFDCYVSKNRDSEVQFYFEDKHRKQIHNLTI